MLKGKRFLAFYIITKQLYKMVFVSVLPGQFLNNTELIAKNYHLYTYDGGFCANTLRLKATDYFRQMIHHRRQTTQ